MAGPLNIAPRFALRKLHPTPMCVISEHSSLFQPVDKIPILESVLVAGLDESWSAGSFSNSAAAHAFRSLVHVIGARVPADFVEKL